MDATVRNLQRKHAVDAGRVRQLAERALSMIGREDAVLSIVFVNNRRIREMNRLYRGIDTPTDVLSFPQGGVEGTGLHEEELGDVIVSVERAAVQAGEAGKSLEEEIDLLVVHGILHLAGFDHALGRAARDRMNRWQVRILSGDRG